MNRVLASCTRVLLLTTLIGCSTTRMEDRPGDVVQAAPVTSVAVAHLVPMMSPSASAKQHVALGVREVDRERLPAARAHFDRALAADPSFALAHLYAAQAAADLPSYRAHLDRAAELADAASPAERLMIRVEQRDFVGDLTGKLDLAQQLVAALPSNPRPLIALASVQFALGRNADARATLERAIQVDPAFAPSHVQLGNSYLVIEPRDLAKAETHIKHAVEREPREAYTHDYMGDAYRALNELAKARAEYTRMTELDPTRAIAYQQRGHVNSFLGNFAEARADYDRAIALGDANEKVSYGTYRALVFVHADDPRGAEQELDRMIASVDAIRPSNPVQAKLFPLGTQFQIALFHKHLDVAQRAADQLRAAWREFGEQGKTPEFRRFAEATTALNDGLLAARKGEYETAKAKAAEYMRLRESENNPRKNEAAHELLGLVALLQGNAQDAVGHLEQSDPNDPFAIYHKALALQAAGRTAEAKAFFKRVAETNFNDAGLALTKRDAARRAG